LTNKSLQDATTFFIDDADATKRVQFQLSGLTTGTTRIITVPDSDITLFGAATTQTLTNKSLQDATTFFIDDVDATKRAQFQLANITTGTTRTITIPDFDLTLFGTTTADTLTNKSLQDATTFFIDDADATKRLQLQLSGITTATTRTLTVPDADTTIVGTDVTQTLTNKTLINPIISGYYASSSFASISLTRGLISSGSSGTWVKIPGATFTNVNTFGLFTTDTVNQKVTYTGSTAAYAYTIRGTLGGTGGGVTVRVSLAVNGVQVGTGAGPSGVNAITPMTGCNTFILNTNDVIEAYWFCTNNVIVQISSLAITIGAFKNPASVYNISSTAATSTTSTTFGTITGMTVSPDPGTYLVMFSSSGMSSNATQKNYALFLNGTQIPDTARVLSGTGATNNNNWFPLYTQCIINTIAGDTITVQFNVVTSGTFNVGTRNLILTEL